MRPPFLGSSTMWDSCPCSMWCSGGHQLPMSSVNTAKARSIGASTTIDVLTAVWTSATGISFFLFSVLFFDSGLERVQRRPPEALEVVPQAGQPVGVEAVDAARPDLDVAHEARLLQDLQVLRDRGPADRQAVGQVHHGGRTLAELLEDGAPGRIAQGIENLGRGGRVSFHLP